MFLVGQNLNYVHMTYSLLENLFLINPNRYLLFGDYFSPHHRNIASEYKLQRKPIMKLKQAFSLVSFTK